MDLSLFSRDVIAMFTAVALSHNMFDAVLCLGVRQNCVRYVDGGVEFWHLSMLFVPAGPMLSVCQIKKKRPFEKPTQAVRQPSQIHCRRVGGLPQPWYLYLLWNREQSNVA